MLWHRILEVLQTMSTIGIGGQSNVTPPQTSLEGKTRPGAGAYGVLPRSQCPAASKYGKGPPASCTMPSDPNNLPPSQLEKWFTKDMFEDLFPFANLGWGSHPCLPYSYEAFVIAARYFPKFGTSSPNSIYNATENTRRDLAAFFAHAVQETGENNAGLYDGKRPLKDAADCFYRGGFYNWFEGGPTSSFMDQASPGYNPIDGEKCISAGRYCAQSAEISYFYPCSNGTDGDYFKGCYFGRGAIQISYNYNYGQFMDFLKTRNISANLLEEPNLIMTKMDPPLAILASLWFYMTPQPPKPAMHDIVMGTWNSGSKNAAAGYTGPIFGPTSLIINNECNGEDLQEPGGPGESRRIKAFKWFCTYFGVPAGADKLLSCKDMPVKLDELRYNYSYQPDWATTWMERPCNCAPAAYGGLIPYFDAAYYPEEFVAMNEKNRLRCVASVYANPSMYSLNNNTSPCLNH
uniref:Glyco_hydro_19_cat domain-containing protein n=1 Tax=Haemonchus contortus TaxID=6289 RepID=A0A7I4YV01_HAECO